NLPFSLRPVRPLLKQQQQATKAKTPGPNIPTGSLYEPPASTRGGGKLQAPGGTATERGDGCPDTPQRVALEEGAARDLQEERATREAWQLQAAAGTSAPVTEESAMLREPGTQQQSPLKSGIPAEERTPCDHPCPQAGTSGEDRAARDTGIGVTPRSTGSPIGYTTKSTNTEMTFKKEPVVRIQRLSE
ncbi:hypothetical protein scyTo_0023944, partial [Scyliorhinus torazame]|nr:hypothetical protein [Scyliorhinus torazame]